MSHFEVDPKGNRVVFIMHCNFTNQISFFQPSTLVELIREVDEDKKIKYDEPETIFAIYFPIHVKVLPKMFEPKELLYDNRQVIK